MNCAEFEDRLNAVLDERGQPQADSRLADHAGECDDCRARLAGSRVLLRGLSRWSVPPLPPEFARRTVALAAPAPAAAAPPAARFWLACGVLLASAAAALLAISLVWYARRGGDQVVRREMPVAPPRIATGPRQRRNLAIANPGASRRLAGNFAGGELLIAAPRLHDHLRGYRGAIDQLAGALPQTAEQLNQMEQFAPGFRPLRLSLAVLWDTLCRTLPGAHENPPPDPPRRTSQWPSAGSQLA